MHAVAYFILLMVEPEIIFFLLSAWTSVYTGMLWMQKVWQTKRPSRMQQLLEEEKHLRGQLGIPEGLGDHFCLYSRGTASTVRYARSLDCDHMNEGRPHE